MVRGAAGAALRSWGVSPAYRYGKLRVVTTGIVDTLQECRPKPLPRQYGPRLVSPNIPETAADRYALPWWH